MKIDLFNEIQDPRPWTDDHEHRRIGEALEQARLGDDLGYDCWWQVEHHGGEEFSLSSAPELMLAAISQRTRPIRLGHSALKMLAEHEAVSPRLRRPASSATSCASGRPGRRPRAPRSSSSAG